MKLSRLLSISLLSISTLLIGCKTKDTVTFVPHDVGGEKSYPFDITQDNIAYKCQIYDYHVDPYAEMSGVSPLASYDMSRIDEQQVQVSGVNLNDREVKLAIRAINPSSFNMTGEEENVLFVYKFTTSRRGNHKVTFNYVTEEISIEYDRSTRR